MAKPSVWTKHGSSGEIDSLPGRPFSSRRRWRSASEKRLKRHWPKPVAEWAGPKERPQSLAFPAKPSSQKSKCWELTNSVSKDRNNPALPEPHRRRGFSNSRASLSDIVNCFCQEARNTRAWVAPKIRLKLKRISAKAEKILEQFV